MVAGPFSGGTAEEIAFQFIDKETSDNESNI